MSFEEIQMEVIKQARAEEYLTAKYIGEYNGGYLFIGEYEENTIQGYPTFYYVRDDNGTRIFYGQEEYEKMWDFMYEKLGYTDDDDDE